MKTLFLYFILMFAFMQIASAQTSYIWNGNTSTAFNVSTNWTPNGLPSTNDNITIVTGSRTCILNAATSIKNITLTSGTFDLGGYLLTVGGTSATFTMGTIQNGTLTILGATTTTFGNSNVTMNCTVNVTSAAITMTKTTFQNALTLVKTGSTNDASAGNNIFNGAVNMTNSGSGYLMMGNGNPDQFNTSAIFNNAGSSHIYVAYNSSNNVFAAATTFNNSPSNTSGTIYVSWLSANTSFNDNIVVSSTNGQGVQFCGGNNTATATLAASKTITIGAGGFSAGTLLLRQFTQIGSMAQNFTLTGTGNLTFGPSSTFGGNVTASTPTLYMNGATFNGTTNLTKTGSTGDWGVGGNIFQGVSTIMNTGSSYLLMGATNPDIWNNDVTFTNSGSERLLPAWSSVGNQFNGNIYVNTSGSAQGIQFCGGNNTATALIAAGKTIQAGSGGLTTGYLYLKQFIQSGNTPINLSATGTATLYIGPSSTFGGAFTATAPDIWAQGAIYNGRATFTKTGGASNHNNQYQNIFNASCTINQQSNTGYFMLGYNSNDLFNDSIIVSSTGSGGIYLGWQPGSNGTPTLAAGKNIYIGSAGFAVGSLNLGGFTQLGNSNSINLTLTGTASFYVYKTANPCVFNGVFNVTAPNLWIEGATFNSRATFTKTGGTSNHNQQYQNIFNASCTINQQSNTGYFMLGYNSNDLFNDSIIVSSTGSGGIYLGWQPGSTGTPTLAAGKNIFVGSAGFAVGSLNFGGFTQLGNSTGINLTLTGTASLYFYKTANPCVFNGALNVTAPDIWVEGATFNAAATFTKTGGNSNHNNQQQNIFNASCTINQQSNTGYFMLGYNSNDLFNDSIIVSSTGTGGIYLGYTGGTGTPTLASGKNIFVGNAGFSTGSLVLGGFIQLGNSTGINLTMTGTSSFYIYKTAANAIFNGTFNVTAPNLWIEGGTFNSAATFTKTSGGGNHNCQIQNIFNSTCTINQQSNTGYFMLGYNSNDLFNDNIIVTSTGTGGIFIGYNSGTGSPTLASGKTITVGSAGFSVGYLALGGFIQLGNSVGINLNMTGTAAFYVYKTATNCIFNAPFNVTAPDVWIEGGTFNSTATFTKTGGTSNHNNQVQNIFNASCTINQQSNTGYFMLGYNSNDLFNDSIIVSSTGSGGIMLGYQAGNGTPTLASGKTITVGSAGFSAGYLNLNSFTQLGNAPINLTFTGATASLSFARNTLIGGTLTATVPSIYFSGATFNGTVNVTKTGTTSDNSSGNNIFNAATTMTNNGSGYILLGNGNADQFNASTIFNNTGSSYIYVAYNSSNNIFASTVAFNNTPTNTSGAIYVSWYSAGTLFNDNMVVTSTNGQGVQFCGSTTATATLAATKTITIGAGGFTAGLLSLKQFTQVGNTPQTFNLTGTAQLYFGSTAHFDGDVVTSSPSIFFNGCTFNKTVNAIKTGSTNDASSGGNIFNAQFTVTNIGSGYLLMGNGNPDLFNATATFNNQSSGQHMYVAYNSTGNIFNGDVIFNNQPSSSGLWIYPNYYGINTQFNGNIVVNNVNGGGIYFGPSTGTATLASGKTISVGSSGFNSGGLIFKGFVQSGLGTPQTLTTTGTSYIQFGSGATFDGAITSSSPGIFFNGCSFNGIVNATKTGSTSDQSQGNNNFNNNSTFTNSGTGYLMMSTTLADAYNSDVTFVQSNTGAVYPNYNGTCTYAGNLTVTSPSNTAITLGAGSGTAKFSGTIAQNISATTGTPTPIFTRLIIANTNTTGVTLNNTSINVSNNLVMTSGLLNTASSSILTMLNGSTTAVGTALSTSYVNGPMNYQKSSSGSTTLNFPIGKGAICHPIALTVTHSSATLYTYKSEAINASAAALNYNLPSTVKNVSLGYYYTISRTDASNTSQPTAGLSGNQTIKVFFNINDGVSDGTTLTIVKNIYTSPTKWFDIGGMGAPASIGGNYLSGSVTSTSSPTSFNSFSTFALGNSVGGINVLPIELISFTAQKNSTVVDLNWVTATESNNDYFDVQKSNDGVSFESLTTIKTQAPEGNSRVILNYSTIDEKPFSGYNYYRLKQFNRDGTFEYSNIVEANFKSDGDEEDEKVDLLNSLTEPALRITTPASWSSSVYTLEIYNEAGQVIKQFDNFTIDGGGSEVKSMELGSLANGLYVAVLTNTTQKRKKSYKVVK